MITNAQLVREGYKMTEFGEIPVEWEVYSLGDLGELMNGLNKGKEDFGFGTPFVNIQDIYKGNVIDSENLGRMNATDQEVKRYKVNKGDILFVRSSVKPEGVGEPALFLSEEEVIFCGFLIRFSNNHSVLLDDKYVLYALKSPYARNQVLNYSSVSANTNINQQNLSKINLFIPALKEQKKIAEILSTVDEQIENTEQLINKTKELKKGLMQQLLTKGIGHTKFRQTELGEIPADWEVKNISKITKVKTGGTPSKSNPEYWENGTIRWMSSGEINLKKIYEVKERITDFGFQNSNTNLLPKKTIMMAMNGQGKTRGTVAILNVETTCNQSLAGILPSSNFNSEYLFYYLESKYEVLRNLTGEGRSGLNLNLIGSFPVVLPTIQEQQKIAEILSFVDDQIESYEKEKEKYMELKKGLMQQLLTGKLRVTV